MGYVVRMPQGGLAWHYLQYAVGLACLGYDVYYVEDSHFFESDQDAWFFDPSRQVMGDDPAFGLRFAADAFGRLGMGERWAFYNAPGNEWIGPVANRATEICATADIVLNVSGANPLRPWLMKSPARALIDTDPAFTQVRLMNSTGRDLLGQHTTLFSFGENIEQCTSTVPQDGLLWHATRQPVVMDLWPVTPGRQCGRFTTAMMWQSTYQSMEHEGVRYGQKSDSFGPYVGLPRRVGRVLEIALVSEPSPRRLLKRNGWLLRDGGKTAPDPWTYQRYIQRSKAEFSVAKHGYVVSNSGWFSERSANYLASGRPVVVQDTGFTDWMQTGAGVLPFTNPDQAVAAIEEVSRRYEYHCRAAREVAEEYFDSDKVLTRLIERAMAPGVG
jgi:hypothetical protein